MTHLIGHVAYWGGAFENILGAEAAADIDPIQSLDVPEAIPYTLHSDSTVSVPHPLWFVRQAVTRETWFYPDLKDGARRVIGPHNRISVVDALRAITIRTAEEKELERFLGSIEVGKVADFVRLSDNPLKYEPGNGGDPTRLTEIKVLETYLGGRPTSRL